MAKSIQDKVILIINGLSESGRVLAEMLAQQGSDVGIVDTRVDPEMANSIKQVVRLHGRRCLVVTPDSTAGAKKLFPQFAIQKIIDTFGQLDAFISYSAFESPTTKSTQENGRLQYPTVFDQAGLTKVALRHIITKKHT